MYGKLNSYLLGNHLNHYLKMSVVHLQSWVMHADQNISGMHLSEQTS